MSTPFPNTINTLLDGEPVTASTPNRPLNQLAQRTVSLKEKIENALIGSAVLGYEVSLSGDTTPGMAVYRSNDGTFYPGLAATELASDGATLVPADSSYIWGVVQYKHTNTQGNVIFNGSMSVREEDLQAVTIDGTAHTGPLYLSATPGKEGYITDQKPPYGIAVGVVIGPTGADTDGEPLYTFFVNPGWKNPLDGHIHYFVRMAIDISKTYAQHITDGTSGWVEDTDAQWATLGITPPSGAVYGYTISTDSSLEPIWPPIPIGSVHYDLDGTSQDLVNNDVILINHDGIWWMDSGNDPDDYTYHDFYFTRMTFKTGQSTVTSLTPSDSSITIQDSNGQDATVGDLFIKANPIVVGDTGDVLSGVAFKTLSDNQLTSGPVVEGIKSSNTDFVTVTGGSALASPNSSYRSGLLTLTVMDPTGQRSGPIEFIELDQVQLEESNGVHYLEFNPGLAAYVRGRVHIPEVGLPSELELSLKFNVWAFSDGTLPDLPITYYKLSPTTTPTSISPSFTSLGDLELSSAGAVTAGQVWSATSPVIAVAPGDVVFFTLSRSSGDAYSGKIGLISQLWRVDPPEESSS